MGRRFVSAILTCLVSAGAGLFAGCGSDAGQQPDAAATQDADFDPCKGTAAVAYTPGMLVTSLSGGYVVTLVSAQTDFSDGSPSVTYPASGLDTWVVSVTDAAVGTPAEVTLTAEKPTMPLHGHGASTFPLVTPGDPGGFTLSAIDFFMSGYWEQKLDLQPSSGAADKATFAICVL